MAKPPSPSPSPSPSSADSAASTTTAAPPSALPTAEAIEVLLSPDGYYRYLGIPLPAPDVLGPKYQEVMGPDTTTADDVVGGSPNGGAIDLDLVKRNYRRLSLRHHPDRRTGDAETFRALNRAKVVLSNPKLRREYDLVGLDLDDDADDHTDHHHHHHHGPADGNVGKSDASAGGRSDRNNGEPHRADDGAAGRDDGAGGAGGGGGGGGGSKTETVMGHLASATLAAVLQVVVRTGLMGAVSVLISRYTILTLPAMCALSYISYKLYNTARANMGKNSKLTFPMSKDVISPLAIAFGIFCMYRGRRFVVASAGAASAAVAAVASSGGAVVENAIVGDGIIGAVAAEAMTASAAAAATTTAYLDWSWTFWFGEALLMSLFVSNSFEKHTRSLVLVCVAVSLLCTLWLRGRFWRYTSILMIEGVIAMVCVVIFPIMEMILESIVEEKMRKVGEKIRQHDRRMRELLMKKKKEQGGSS